MTEKEIKKAYSDVERELKEEQEAEVKRQVKSIVKTTLSKIEKLKEERDEIDGKIKILKLDIDDLKEGHLDRIKERQEKDPKAREISVIIVKEKEIIRERVVSPWYRPYEVYWTASVPVNTPYVYCNATNFKTSLSNTIIGNDGNNCITLNNSLAKDNTAGTYQLENKIVHLR
jgi:hypothetical protein